VVLTDSGMAQGIGREPGKPPTNLFLKDSSDGEKPKGQGL
jgi:hypothetical protein